MINYKLVEAQTVFFTLLLIPIPRHVVEFLSGVSILLFDMYSEINCYTSSHIFSGKSNCGKFTLT